MSTFENEQYKWRETYFVLFSAAKRPTLGQDDQGAARPQLALRA